VARHRQLAAFLTAVRSAPTAYERRHYPLFLLLARSGVRLGEALALQWDDVHFAEKEIRITRTLSSGRIEKPKSGHSRTVDMSDQLARVLLRLYAVRKTATLKRGWSNIPQGVFCTEAGTFRTRAVSGRSCGRR
jgi:integrase